MELNSQAVFAIGTFSVTLTITRHNFLKNFCPQYEWLCVSFLLHTSIFFRSYFLKYKRSLPSTFVPRSASINSFDGLLSEIAYILQRVGLRHLSGQDTPRRRVFVELTSAPRGSNPSATRPGLTYPGWDYR